MEELNWEKLLSANNEWLSKLLTQHEIKRDSKVVLRVFSLKFNGTEYDSNAFVSRVIGNVKNYVLTPNEKQKIETEEKEPFVKARGYFGDTNPVIDGKYGELILYLFTETILKTPLIAFKIPTNQNDQIKGGDGIFIGNYESKPAILIGEAKIHQDLNGALNSAFESLDRFHGEANFKFINHEMFVASRGIKRDLSEEEINYILDCFTTDSVEYLRRIKVHPVLIIYDENKINEITAADNEDGNNKLKSLIATNIDKYLESILKLNEVYKEVKKVYLDFFFLPLIDVMAFKKALYFGLHGTQWQPPTNE